MTATTLNLKDASLHVMQAASWLKHLGIDNALIARRTNGVPLNFVKGEAVRQVASVALPVAVVVGSILIGGVTSLYLGLPVAVALFMAMDAHLAWSQRGLVSCDEGRTDLTEVIAKGLGIEPSALTKVMVMELAAAYTQRIADEKARDALAAKRHEAFLDAVRADTARMRTERLAGKKVRINRALLPNGIQHWLSEPSSKPAGRTFAPGSYAAAADADGVIPMDAFPIVNTNGMPMIANTGVDVTGNAYGT